MEQKISLGSARIKRRARTMEESESKGQTVKIPGMWVSESTYAMDTGRSAQEDGHQLYDVEDPLSGEKVPCVFLPKHRPGIYEGEFVQKKKLRLTNKVDDDETALRPGQVAQTYHSQASAMAKQLPQVSSSSRTFQDYLQIKDDVKRTGGTQEDWDCAY